MQIGIKDLDFYDSYNIFLDDEKYLKENGFIKAY